MRLANISFRPSETFSSQGSPGTNEANLMESRLNMGEKRCSFHLNMPQTPAALLTHGQVRTKKGTIWTGNNWAHCGLSLCAFIAKTARRQMSLFVSQFTLKCVSILVGLHEAVMICKGVLWHPRYCGREIKVLRWICEPAYESASHCDLLYLIIRHHSWAQKAQRC